MFLSCLFSQVLEMGGEFFNDLLTNCSQLSHARRVQTSPTVFQIAKGDFKPALFTKCSWDERPLSIQNMIASHLLLHICNVVVPSAYIPKFVDK